MSKIKIFFSDIDGVWTNGGMYYTNRGDEFKKFNTKDSAGILLLRELNIETVIITGENTRIVKNRAEKLGIRNIFLGIKDKLKVAKKFLSTNNLTLDECAYIGDDYADLELLNSVGLSACPADAVSGIIEVVDWVLETKGGDGVYREFVEKYISEIVQIPIESLYKQIYSRNE